MWSTEGCIASAVVCSSSISNGFVVLESVEGIVKIKVKWTYCAT